MAHETEPDVEALQAQIDLSMAFAHNLVSSWMQSKAAPPKQSLDAELKEYMRKPPRLGVGASVSDTAASSAREIARLKTRLTGKKRLRAEDGHVISVVQSDDDDDSDSKTHAIRKKPKLDPFAGNDKKKSSLLPVQHADQPKQRKKKKKKDKLADNPGVEARRQSATEASVLNFDGSVAIQPAPASKKKKKRHHKKRASVSNM